MKNLQRWLLYSLLLNIHRRLVTLACLCALSIDYSIYAPATQVNPLSQQNLYINLLYTVCGIEIYNL